MKQDILVLATKAFGDKAATLYMRELEKFAELISEDEREGQAMKDETWELKEQIWTKVHDLVDEMTKNLDEEEDEILRQALTEEFRFWRRSDP
jgi:flagellin-specific chaperone FliS